ncbi:hypothetical protein NQ314_006320 [Rhamnusium bicolor]|uniref:Uncharacterized protein n=1 Tax=Rhamnusium bicolor TaxID=1586634 RepID=A0AAV8Z647_9CUCU|nr:hypothetical protein NQ314_006320 [Rhamnusium bicolor]
MKKKFAVSPNRTKENYAVGMVALKDTYYYNYNTEQQFKVFFTLIELILYSNPPNGFIFVVNCKGVIV